MSVFEKQVYVPAELLQALGEHTGHYWASPMLEPIICDAVRAWMKPAPPVQQQPTAPSEAGCQWKQVFLPEGTRLRACFGGQPYFAVVEGAQIKHGEQAISPSCFANLRGSGNRNAWKAIWLRLPGSDAWLLADVCRSARKTAIARMFGGDAAASKPRVRTPPRPRQGPHGSKPPASPRTRASDMPSDGRAFAAQQRAPQPSGAVPGQVRPPSAPGNDPQHKQGSGRAARRKRRAAKYARGGP